MKETYKLWLDNSSDRRYLRPVRWTELKKALFKYNVKRVLEFGAGISTILISNLGIDLTSLETDEEYLKFVKSLCPNEVKYILWDGEKVPLNEDFDLIFVDGDLPRLPQLLYAISHTEIVAIDDFAGSIKNSFLPHLGWFRRDNENTFMAIFRSFKNLTNYDNDT